MSGSLVLNASPTPRERSIELLRINFSSGTNLVVYGDGKFGSVTLADASIAEAKLSSLSHLDICSSSFDPVRSVERIKKEGEVTVAKALLDQDVCPGVGNIIKQEALHRAKVHPKRRVKDISHEDLKVLVRELRDFSMKWYLQSRPESIVYNRTDCGECGGKVRVVKDDDTANRVTFYCEGCCEGGREGKGKKKQKIEEKKPFLTMRGHTCNGPSEKLQRVRKQNNNKDRLFWSCRKKNCAAQFSWADNGFPNCKCLPISKTRVKLCKKGNNAGRCFFCCRTMGTKGCGFFDWAEPKFLDKKFGEHLSPLT